MPEKEVISWALKVNAKSPHPRVKIIDFRFFIAFYLKLNDFKASNKLIPLQKAYALTISAFKSKPATMGRTALP
ncbi:hypothetical protein B4Q04_15865 [Zobellia sp. OII3]|nr:hypothetical protein B4Q04_15865 [Zobellia sp. OII3]